MLDIVEGVSWNQSTAHFYDTIYHSEGVFSLDSRSKVPSTFTGSPGDDVAWSYLTNRKALTTMEGWTAKWTTMNEYHQHFEVPGLWTVALIIDASRYKDGKHSGRWENHLATGGVSTSAIPEDWSAMSKMTMWMFSETANNASITVLAFSENASTSGPDYYSLTFKVTWTGWKQFTWLKNSSWSRSRRPIGWHSISSFSLSSTWFGTPLGTTKLWLDALMFYRADGTLMDVPPCGLQITSPETMEEKQLFIADSISIPTSFTHPVVIERSREPVLSVHLLKMVTNRTSFITNFKADTDDIVIETLDRSFTVSSTTTSCWTNVVKKMGAVETVVLYKCQSYQIVLSPSLTLLFNGSSFDALASDVSHTTSSLSAHVTVGARLSVTLVFQKKTTGDKVHVGVNRSTVDLEREETGDTASGTFVLDVGTWQLLAAVGETRPSSFGSDMSDGDMQHCQFGMIVLLTLVAMTMMQ